MKQFGVMVVLQNTGEVYDGPMKGFQITTKPPKWDEEDNRWKSDFTLNGLKSGTYNLKVFATDLCAEFIPGIVVNEGANTLADIVLSTGSALSGTILKADGTKITTSEVEMVVAATQDMSELVFGEFVVDEGTQEIESYSIKGLKKGKFYTVVLPIGRGDNLFMAPVPQFIKEDAQTYNITFQDYPPFFMTWITKLSSTTVMIESFVSETIRESAGTDVVKLDEVIDTNENAVSGRAFDSITISNDKTYITAVYTFGDTEASIKYHLEATDLAGNKQQPSNYAQGYPFSYTYYKGWDNLVQKSINPVFGGSVGVGNGDGSEINADPGDFSTDEDINMTIAKTEASDAPGGAGAPRFAAACYPKGLPLMSRKAVPADAAVISNLYDISAQQLGGGNASIAADQTITVTLQYDSTLIPAGGSTSNLYVCRYDETDQEWDAIDQTQTVDTVNKTISAQTNHLSYYAVFYTPTAPSFAVASPAITAVSPSSAKQGETLQVTITGTNIKAGATASFSGTGITIGTTTVNATAGTIVLDVVIGASAVQGQRNVTVTNSDGGTATSANAFRVTSSAIYLSQVSATEAFAGATFNVTATGIGLGVFTNHATTDTLKLIHQTTGAEIIGSSTSISGGGVQLGLSFVIPSNAAIGTYDLVLYDGNDGPNFASYSGITVNVSPYSGGFKTYVYPNPATTGSVNIKVCIPGTTATLDGSVESVIKVYNAAGEEIWTKTATMKKGYGAADLDANYAGQNVITWDCANQGGEKVASGVYFYTIDVKGIAKDKGKIAIIK